MVRRGAVLAWVVGAVALAAPAWAAPPDGGHVDVAEAPRPPVLLEQALLTYPPEALADRAHGDVHLKVSLDAEGAVVDAEVLDGPEVFHAEALRAARTLVFTPARRGDTPIASAVMVHFHFAPPDDDLMDDDAELVVVEAPDADRIDTHASTTIDAEAIARTAGDDLARVAARVAGVTAASGTADVAKPIVRGQTERRLALVVDGVAHASQDWGPDHAPEIDPFTAGSIRVVRGAAGVRHGPEAVGGALVVDPLPLRATPGVGGAAQVTFASNGLRPGADLRVDAVPAKVPELSFRVQGGGARGAALDAPGYVLGNTAQARWHAGAAVQYARDTTRLRVAYEHVGLQAGIFYGTVADSADDLAARVAGGVPPGAEAWTRSYTLDRPLQAVTHDRLTARGRFGLGGWGAVEATYAFQLNHRQEYEAVRGDITRAQYDFTLRTHTAEVVFAHDPLHVGSALFEGAFGVTGDLQEHVFTGLPLVPNFRALHGGTYGWERVGWARGGVELGLRLDHQTRDAFLDPRDAARWFASGGLDRDRCDVDDVRAACPSAWTAGSVTLGGFGVLVPGVLDLKVDLSSASRFPDVDEQYLLGTAPSLPVWATGDPDLGVETTWSASPTLVATSPWITAELSAYVQFVQDHIQFAPALGPDGTPSSKTTIQGTFPAYAYTPTDALFYGADGAISLFPEAVLGLDAIGSLVRGDDLIAQRPLIGIPSDRLHLEAIGRPPDGGRIEGAYVSASVDLVDRQHRHDPARDLAPAPDGYVLVGLDGGFDVALDRTTLSFGLSVRNLGNVAYRDITSLLRYVADAPGRDVRLRMGIEF